MKIISFALLFIIMSFAHSQDSDNTALPYHQIPEAPADYTAGNVISRMIDGLGYRYYWASKDLTEEDLSYKPSEDGKTTFETLQHIYTLTETVDNAPQSKPNIRPVDISAMSYEDLRKGTLNYLKNASDLCRGKTAEDIAEMAVIFQRGDRKSEFPYWNMLNGPLADAIYHTGQIVSFRRSSGNPINPKVNVFMGKTRE